MKRAREAAAAAALTFAQSQTASGNVGYGRAHSRDVLFGHIFYAHRSPKSGSGNLGL